MKISKDCKYKLVVKRFLVGGGFNEQTLKAGLVSEEVFSGKYYFWRESLDESGGKVVFPVSEQNPSNAHSTGFPHARLVVIGEVPEGGDWE